MFNKLIIIVYICLFNNYLIIANNSFDFRFLSYNGMSLIFKRILFYFSYIESLENVQIYENDDQEFGEIIIDEEKDQIIVGGK